MDMIAANQLQEVAQGNDWKNVAMSLATKSLLSNPIEKPIFSPGISNSVDFLDRFEKFTKRIKLPEAEKLCVVKDCLRSSAFHWHSLKEDSWKSFDEFKTEFLIDTIRRREHLHMSDFFLSQAAGYHRFIPSLPEVIIMAEVMRQMPFNV
ncbi:hypothetical protein ILUMI_08254 [Ignelater luminosus]|uniref:Uncharacterized protein n=1 Tax=Ignelater luminosus TaxID=2038154 RepID=A0A8K0D1Z1_IGNLU|nr:hypothetical protein ILUMI_08254 [Ignelater luminosus]